MKIEKLKEYIGNLSREGILIAFSAGVDSTLILKIASLVGRGEVIACTFTSFLSPKEDIGLARQIAKEYCIELIEIELDQRKDPNIMNNTEDRCYHCKRMIFSKMVEIAKEKNLQYILDGTNLDDLKIYRPGLRALQELNIISPLAECEISKKEVRELALDLGISVAKKPSTPCLATRFPYNKRLPIEKFEMVEAGEKFLKDLGFNTVRIRVYDDLTRIEIPEKNFKSFIRLRKDIVTELKKLGFKYINLDMEGFRSGSMDE